ncbi:MASE1 domain-containing protein [Streptomyces sp. Go40/10]|uniref:MASE1 domain-containing protein n=1 Tax=Streptomyces sp. Go40/10 TaxID=2825844 RepID=UPI001E57E79E|nr:MASE1 domain-containing protein [Streptomyces sp. Go40/10]UFR00523.1 MASE1 domain-containing protein [Streptomyces sp. Go40/10]
MSSGAVDPARAAGGDRPARAGRGTSTTTRGARRGGLRGAGRTALQIVAVAALYYASGKLGLFQQLVRGQVTPLWPPTGISLAGLLLFGPRIWPGIALGAFLINLSLGPSLPAVLAITAGNTLAPLCSYALLRRVGFRTSLNRFRDALALVFLGGFAGMLISATVGSGTLRLAHALPAGGFWPTWWVWWTGDAMGVLVVTPVLLVLRSAHLPKHAPPSRWHEAMLLAAATIGVGLLENAPPPLAFLAFPLLTCAAFRFQLAGTAPCALAVSTSAILAATRGTGPFAGHTLVTNMIALQAFNGAAAMTALLLAAVVTERNEAQQKIEETCRRLAEMAARIAPDTGGPPVLPRDRSDEEESGGPTRRP